MVNLKVSNNFHQSAHLYVPLNEIEFSKETGRTKLELLPSWPKFEPKQNIQNDIIWYGILLVFRLSEFAKVSGDS